MVRPESSKCWGDFGLEAITPSARHASICAYLLAPYRIPTVWKPDALLLLSHGHSSMSLAVSMVGRPPTNAPSLSEFARPRVHQRNSRLERHPYTNRVKYDQRKLRRTAPEGTVETSQDGLQVSTNANRCPEQRLLFIVMLARFPRCHPVPLTSCPSASS